MTDDGRDVDAECDRCPAKIYSSQPILILVKADGTEVLCPNCQMLYKRSMEKEQPDES